VTSPIDILRRTLATAERVGAAPDAGTGVLVEELRAVLGALDRAEAVADVVARQLVYDQREFERLGDDHRLGGERTVHVQAEIVWAYIGGKEVEAEEAKEARWRRDV
jgi:hypothetical protein